MMIVSFLVKKTILERRYRTRKGGGISNSFSFYVNVTPKVEEITN